MEKIFEIAQGITNPYSLLALTYLVLFVLFRGVLTKAGPQRGEKAYQIIRYLMTLVAVIAVMTLLSVFALRAYEVYQGTEVTAEKVSQNTQKVVASAVIQLSDPDLQVEYSVQKYTGANILLGNRGQGIIIVSELTLHWDYRECPKYREPGVGLPLVTYRYKVDLTKSKGSKLLDSREFKYGAGDVDKFLVDLKFPDYGVYAVWLTFNYKKLGEETSYRYETQHIERELCEKSVVEQVADPGK
ncbi:MAG: hypothetical protein AB9919_11100 [Geobacteraceae bacterium]